MKLIEGQDNSAQSGHCAGRSFTAFAGYRRVSSGAIRATLIAVKAQLDAGGSETVLVFDDDTGAQIDFDWRGSAEDVLARLAEHPAFIEVAREDKRTGPGRPKLGVVSREVTLLPRHWQWLEAQPGGISAALRRLVEEARKAHPEEEEAHRKRDAMSRFMWAMTGNLPGFEEASRALFANDRAAFFEQIRAWPEDLRDHLTRLAQAAFLTQAPDAAEPAPAQP